MNKCGSGSPSLLPPSLPPSLPHLFDMFHAMLFIGCPTPRENKFFGRIDIFKCVKDIKEMGQVLAWIPHAEGRERRREGGGAVMGDCGCNTSRRFAISRVGCMHAGEMKLLESKKKARDHLNIPPRSSCPPSLFPTHLPTFAATSVCSASVEGA